MTVSVQREARSVRPRLSPARAHMRNGAYNGAALHDHALNVGCAVPSHDGCRHHRLRSDYELALI